MHADDDMRTPFVELTRNVTNRAFVKEFTCVWAESIDEPVVVLHPMLLVTQQPVVDGDELCCKMMRLFDRANRPNRVRLALHKRLNPRHDRRRRRAMTAAGIGGDDQDFRCVRIHSVGTTCASRWLIYGALSAALMRAACTRHLLQLHRGARQLRIVPIPCSPSSSRARAF